MKTLQSLVIVSLMLVVGCQKVSSTSADIHKDSMIAFSRLTDGYWQIWVSNVDGSNARQQTFSAMDKRHPVWGGQGNELYFRNNNRQIFKTTLNSSGPEQRIYANLGSIDDLAFSRDGLMMAVVRFKDQYLDNANIWIANSDGQNYRSLTSQSSLQYNPSISPTGKMVAYISSSGHHHTDELHIINLESNADTQLTKNDYQEICPSFSPDGQTIVYVSDITGDYEIWKMNTDGTNKQQLTFSPGLDSYPTFSPDGQRILFTSNFNGKLHICLMKIDGSELKRINNGSPCIDPAWRLY